jgi:hypothetical protein
MYELKYLVESTSHTQVKIETSNEYIPLRPINGTIKYKPLSQRFKDAWEVFMCRADAFKWPGNQ